MPTFNTLNGIISIQPSAHGFRATFNAYPMKDTIDEEEATEEAALASLVESLSNIAVEARNSVGEYLKKRKAHEARLDAAVNAGEAKRAKVTKPPKHIYERENLTARRIK